MHDTKQERGLKAFGPARLGSMQPPTCSLKVGRRGTSSSKRAQYCSSNARCWGDEPLKPANSLHHPQNQKPLQPWQGSLCSAAAAYLCSCCSECPWCWSSPWARCLQNPAFLNWGHVQVELASASVTSHVVPGCSCAANRSCLLSESYARAQTARLAAIACVTACLSRSLQMAPGNKHMACVQWREQAQTVQADRRPAPWHCWVS
jgi:hypothetical protein